MAYGTLGLISRRLIQTIECEALSECPGSPVSTEACGPDCEARWLPLSLRAETVQSWLHIATCKPLGGWYLPIPISRMRGEKDDGVCQGTVIK